MSDIKTATHDTAAKRICVFAGANGNRFAAEIAGAVGYELGKRGATVVYGGGRRGVMGKLASEAKAAGGNVIGVFPSFLALRVGRMPDAETMVMPDMQSRRQVFWQCDGYVCLPGGFGTMTELFECLDLMYLGQIPTKPIAIVDNDCTYDGLRVLFKDMAARELTKGDKHCMSFDNAVEAVNFACSGE